MYKSFHKTPLSPPPSEAGFFGRFLLWNLFPPSLSEYPLPPAPLFGKGGKTLNILLPPTLTYMTVECHRRRIFEFSFMVVRASVFLEERKKKLDVIHLSNPSVRKLMLFCHIPPTETATKKTFLCVQENVGFCHSTVMTSKSGLDSLAILPRLLCCFFYVLYVRSTIPKCRNSPGDCPEKRIGRKEGSNGRESSS